MLKQITNGRILTPEGWLEGGSVLVEDGKIVEVANNERPIVGAEIIDAKGCDLVPVASNYTSTVVVAATLWKVQKRLSARP